jgi:TonB family protein
MLAFDFRCVDVRLRVFLANNMPSVRHFRSRAENFGRAAMLALMFLFAANGAFAQESQTGNSAPPPATAPQNTGSPPKRLRVGGNVMTAKLIRQPLPIYPSEAKKAHIEGTVLLHVIIAKDGTIGELQFVSGPPMLMKAAMDAVSQWRYQPTLLAGEPVDIDTTISIVFTLGGKPPLDLRDADSLSKSSTSEKMSESPPANMPPPMHPAASRMGKTPYADTLEGMKSQMETVLKAGASGDEEGFAEALDSFAIEDPKAWLAQTFGTETGATLVAGYETSLSRFKEHITRVSDAWAKSPTSYLLVENSLVPKPPEGDEDSKPPKPVSPPNIEDFRFYVKTGQVDPGDWVFSFIYVDGAFRIVGGTYAYWDDSWNMERNRKSMEAFAARAQEYVAIEGFAVDCPGNGLLRVMVSPKVQAGRLRTRVEPIYPEEAKKAGIEGMVLFHAIIATDGSVEELELEDGDPILSKAVEEAVKQWRYAPMIYHSQVSNRDRPAEVDTAIAVQIRMPQ